MADFQLMKWYIKNINLPLYFKLNFFSKNIIREDKHYIRPYKNAVINIDKEAKIYIKGKHIDVGINKLKGSKAETYLRMSKGAVWYSNNGCSMYYNADLEIKENAIFTSGFFTENSGSAIVCTTKITIGDNVMMGRNNLIYDSDFHSMLSKTDKVMNYNREVSIADNVWITSNVTILKGVSIGAGSIVSANSTVTTAIPEESIAGGDSTAKVRHTGIKWSRKYPGRRKND